MRNLKDLEIFRDSLTRMARIIPEIGIEAKDDEDYFGFIPYMIMQGVVDVILKRSHSEEALEKITQEMVNLAAQSFYLENMVAVCFVEMAVDYEDFYNKIEKWLPNTLKSTEQ